MVAHPDSDHLNICQVAIGMTKQYNCCGAPNVRVGLKPL